MIPEELVVGWSLRDDHVEALRRIAAVPAPAQDPVFGKDGPLVREWR